MTIKRQFKFLIISIISIPVICTIFLLAQNYLHSSKRYLIKNEIDIELTSDSSNEYEKDIEIIKTIPNTVETALIDISTTELICNTMTGLENATNAEDLWAIIKNTFEDYYYQFTKTDSENNTVLITRIPRTKRKMQPSQKIITTLMILFIIGILISIISILIISKTIFNSIIEIKNTTIEIANGNLNKEIIIPDKKNKQNEIMTILESLEIMRLSLCDAEKRKNNFIMGISHDLRTPIAIIKGYTEAISDGVISENKDVKKALTLIESKTTQLEDMVNDLIKFTRLNSYELGLQFETKSITELIKTFSKECKLTANVFNREVISNINLTENIKIPFNEKLILRAFENLFINAIRYTHDNDKIFINASSNENEVLFELKDTGIGINKKDLPNIFDLFYKGSRSRQGNSMGIGLAVVKNILDVHDWDITVNSTKGIGTSFKISIPIKKINENN